MSEASHGAGGGVLAHLDVGAGAAERCVGQWADAKVEFGQLLRQRVEGHARLRRVALVLDPEVDADRSHTYVRIRVEHLPQDRGDAEPLGVDHVLGAGVPADHEAVMPRGNVPPNWSSR